MADLVIKGLRNRCNALTAYLLYMNEIVDDDQFQLLYPYSQQPKPYGQNPPGRLLGTMIKVLAANQFDVRCISLRFDSPSRVLLRLTVGSGSFDFPVGMDGVPRFSETGPTGIPVGTVGEWIEPNVFTVRYDEVAGPNHLRIRADFAQDAQAVELEFADPTGYFPPQTVAAPAVSGCNSSS